jgi:glycosyltransferase involved in cell wall biosynthesis
MRILHITDNYGFTGGIQSYLKHLSALLRKKGHTAEIYSPSESRETVSSYLSRWISYKDYLAVKEIVAQFEPDILHGHSISMRISPLPFLAARIKKIPVVMTVHDFGYVCPRKWMIYRDESPCSYGFGFRCLVSNCPSNKNGWLYLPYHNLRWLKIALHRCMLKRYVRTFVCPSRVLARWMTKSLNVHNIVCIPNFVERILFLQQDVQNDNQLLFVGRLSEEKGVGCLLKAMPNILATYPDAFLTIVGDGPVRQKLESLSHSLKIDENVCFAGTVENERLDEYYRRATICVLPSLWMENCPVTGLEALAFGIPLVGSNIGGIPAMIQDGKTGFLFIKNDHMDLAEKIGLLIKNQELLNVFRENSLSFFQQSFTEEKHYEQILSLYSSLVKQ